MHPLEWLCHHKFVSLIRCEQDWHFTFDGKVRLDVHCIWRLLMATRIRLTSLDDGQQFGLPVPLNAANEVNIRLKDAIVVAVDLQPGTLDLRITLNSGYVVEVLPDSSGYESWSLFGADQEFIAVGGGDLVIAKDNREDR